MQFTSKQCNEKTGREDCKKGVMGDITDDSEKNITKNITEESKKSVIEDISEAKQLLSKKGFTIRKVLGEGATAIVFQVQRMEAGREISAEKMHRSKREGTIEYQLNMDSQGKQAGISNFYACKVSKQKELLKAEAELLKTLNHPLFPNYEDWWEEGAYGFFCMEYIEGSTLAAFLRRRGRLPWQESVRILLETADGLRYLHERQPVIIYRDLKPENLILSAKGQVRLVDLGTAALQKGWKVWNEAYRLPERGIAYLEPTPREDIYGLGILAFKMMGEKLSQVLAKNRQENVRTNEKRRSISYNRSIPYGRGIPYGQDIPNGRGIPYGLRQLALWCIRENPQERPQDMSTLIRRLTKWRDADTKTKQLFLNLAAWRMRRKSASLLFEKNIVCYGRRV